MACSCDAEPMRYSALISSPEPRLWPTGGRARIVFSAYSTYNKNCAIGFPCGKHRRTVGMFGGVHPFSSVLSSRKPAVRAVRSGFPSVSYGKTVLLFRRVACVSCFPTMTASTCVSALHDALCEAGHELDVVARSRSSRAWAVPSPCTIPCACTRCKSPAQHVLFMF